MSKLLGIARTLSPKPVLALALAFALFAGLQLGYQIERREQMDNFEQLENFNRWMDAQLESYHRRDALILQYAQTANPATLAELKLDFEPNTSLTADSISRLIENNPQLQMQLAELTLLFSMATDRQQLTAYLLSNPAAPAGLPASLASQPPSEVARVIIQSPDRAGASSRLFQHHHGLREQVSDELHEHIESVTRLTNILLYSSDASLLLVIAAIFWVAIVYARNERRLEAAEQKNQLMQALELALEETEQHKNALETKNQQQARMFSIIAHELRTPAAAIQMLAQEGDEASDRRSDLESSSEHLLQVIDDLRQAINPDLDFVIQQRPFSAESLTREIQRQIAPLFARGELSLQVSIDQPSPHSLYLSDPFRLRAIVTNLLRNAYYHSEGRKVALSVTVAATDDAGQLMTVRVEDDGKGIPPGDVERLFSPFERGDSKASGTGVGLHLVKTWTEKLGGSILCEHSPMGGAAFIIGLPLTPATESTEEADQQLLDSARALLKNKTVLLVEDDELLGKVQHNILKKNFNCVIHRALHGLHALELAAEHAVDLVITDYFMPEMDGVGLINALRATGHNMPIIALTAATIGEERAELAEAGADHVLPKPLDIRMLADALLSLEGENRLDPVKGAQSRSKSWH